MPDLGTKWASLVLSGTNPGPYPDHRAKLGEAPNVIVKIIEIDKKKIKYVVFLSFLSTLESTLLILGGCLA